MEFGRACAPRHPWGARPIRHRALLTRSDAVTESVLAVTAAVWGIAMGLSPLLQVRRMRLTRSSRDVSVPYFLVLNVGFLVWFMYGLASSNLTVALPNVVALTVGTITIVTAQQLRRAVPTAGDVVVIAEAVEDRGGRQPHPWVGGPREGEPRIDCSVHRQTHRHRSAGCRSGSANRQLRCSRQRAIPTAYLVEACHTANRSIPRVVGI